MARVTVIVPTYNRAGYLGEAISSILHQDYRDFELVVADNASTDRTTALLADVADTRLRHVRRPHNIGWRANFNQALHDTDSEFVALVSDDDRLLPGALARAVTFLDEAPSVGLVHTTLHTIDDRGELLRSCQNWTGHAPDENHLQRGSDFIVSSMQIGCPVCLSSALMRTAVLPEVCFEAADEEAGDFGLFLRVALDADIGFLGTPAVELRVHRGRLSNTYDTVDALRILEACKLRFLSANSAHLEDVEPLRRAACGYTATRLSLTVSMAASNSRSDGMKALLRTVRFRPQLLLAPRMWRAACKIVVGPRILRSLRRMRPDSEVRTSEVQ